MGYVIEKARESSDLDLTSPSPTGPCRKGMVLMRARREAPPASHTRSADRRWTRPCATGSCIRPRMSRGDGVPLQSAMYSVTLRIIEGLTLMGSFELLAMWHKMCHNLSYAHHEYAAIAGYKAAQVLAQSREDSGTAGSGSRYRTNCAGEVHRRASGMAWLWGESEGDFGG